MAKIPIKKNQLTKIYIYTAVIAVSLAITGVVYMWDQKLREKSGWIQNDITALNLNITRARNSAKEYEQAKATWTRLESGQKQVQGVNIDKARQLITQLEKRYRLGRLDVNMTAPVPARELQRKFRTSAIEVEQSVVRIEFSAVSDVHALSFINALSRQLPGFVKVTELRIERTGQVTPSILDKIKEGDLPPLVKVKLDFIWQDFKKTSDKSEKKT